VRGEPAASAGSWCVAATTPVSTIKITTVRMSVAASGLNCSTPSLANIAVMAANAADISAQTCHDATATLPLTRSMHRTTFTAS